MAGSRHQALPWLYSSLEEVTWLWALAVQELGAPRRYPSHVVPACLSRLCLPHRSLHREGCTCEPGGDFIFPSVPGWDPRSRLFHTSPLYYFLLPFYTSLLQPLLSGGTAFMSVRSIIYRKEPVATATPANGQCLDCSLRLGPQKAPQG